MKRIGTLMAVAALALGAAGTRAQAPSQPGPSPEMKKLEFLIGKWTARGKTYFPNQEPREFTETREAVWHPGGSFIRIQVRRENRPDRVVEPLIMIGYDPRTKLYRTWQFGVPNVPMEGSGQFESTKLVLAINAERPPQPPEPIVGIGAQLVPMPTPEGHIRIGRPIPGSPAARAGVKADDLITHIDGKSVVGMTSDQAVAALRGTAGTSVRLTLQSAGATREVTLTREALAPDPTIQGFRMTLEPGPGPGFSFLVEAQREGRFEKRTEAVFTASP